MTDEAWIEQSLARLETLEADKAQLEAAGQAIPAQLDEEIATLYEALEAAAGGEDGAVAAPEAAAPAGPVGGAVSDDPFAPAPAPAPMAAAPAAAPAGPPAMMASDSMDSYDDDFESSGGKGGLIAVAVVAVLGIGAGGWWFMNQKAEPEAAPAPQGDPKVISASSVPEDTQEPQAAKGANAERTEGTRYKEGATPAASNSGGKRTSGNRPRNRGKKKDDGRKVKVSDSRDPLAGI